MGYKAVKPGRVGEMPSKRFNRGMKLSQHFAHHQWGTVWGKWWATLRFCPPYLATWLSPQQFNKKIKQLEKEMYQFAANLEFEKAAQLRDQIQWLRDKQLVF
jgi:excinuclease UvrABC helicase subunit UvrB